MPTLEDAIVLATEAHRGQLDKAGRAYILHPLAVMLQMSTDELRLIAVLHDVVEDTSVTLDDLRSNGFPERVVAAVDRLTRRPDEEYEAFVRRAAAEPLARVVKIADARNNLDTSRALPDNPENKERQQRYIRALEILEKWA